MFNYTIAPLDTTQLQKICDDIQEQHRQGIAQMALFCFTLVPEGTPPIDKTSELCRRFSLFQEELQKRGLKAGVLLQSTIGHGWPLNAPNPFQRYFGVMDQQYVDVCCPLDPAVQEHFREVCQKIARTNPALMLVDDDFRLIAERSGRGCVCPLHVEEFNRRTGRNDDAAAIKAHLEGNSDEDKALADIFQQLQIDSLCQMAQEMRNAIDEVDPAIPGGFCTCHTDVVLAPALAKILSGKGNPTLVRVNNAFYLACNRQLHHFPTIMVRTADQLHYLREAGVEEVLTETDTYPQNRYSTPARTLHAHFTHSLLSGCDGAKHWISRLVVGSNEWRSANAYRKTLTTNQGFYAAAEKLGKALTWDGLRLPIPKKPARDFNTTGHYRQNNWFSALFYDMGMPIFVGNQAGTVLLSGDEVAAFSDDELRSFLAGTVLLDSTAALALQQRGLGEMLGVTLKEWSLPHPTREALPEGNTSSQEQLMELIPQGAEVDSWIHHAPYQQSLESEPIAPGVTIFHNAAGGTVIVTAGATPSHGHTSYGFRCENRKQQLLRILNNAQQLPLWYDGDGEVYLRSGTDSEGNRYVVLTNMGLDPVEDMTLHCPQKVAAMEVLTPAGEWQIVPFHQSGEVLEISSSPAETMLPIIFKMQM